MANAGARPSEWLAPALLIVGAVTAWRVALMAFNQTDLFVDEAQYWFWGQELAFGYYSKPPLIGWVIRASVELGGADAPFWVRLPAPLLHMVTALIFAAIAGMRYGRSAALWIAAIYITLPMVTVGSFMISTDTVMYPFLVAGLGMWLACLDRGGHIGFAVAAGGLVGFAFLGKYAALYLPLCAALAACVMWQARPGWRAAGAALAAFVIVISPNVIWNVVNGLTTLQHTLDNADWVRDPGARAALNWAGLAEFFVGQFAVFGPVMFGALLWLGLTRGAGSSERRLLLWFALPVLATVCTQALLSEAYANWGVAGYAAGLLAVVPWLLSKARGWLWATLALHGTLALAVPVLTAFGTEWRVGPEQRLLLARYLGRVEMSEAILDLARAHGGVVVADDRDVLADLFHATSAGTVAIWAAPEAGRPSNHYVQQHAYPGGAGRVLFVSKRSAPPEGCTSAQPVAVLAPPSGAYRDRAQTAWVLDGACLLPERPVVRE